MATTSFDPNEMLVDATTITPTEVTVGKALGYTVHFQNTGSAPAVNVVVRDTLDTDLDLSTFQMVGATHPYVLTIDDRVATWTFNNIMLPDSSTDAEASRGGLHFRCALRQNVVPGDH